MTPLDELRKLADLAHDHTDESRRTLLRQITDVFLLTPGSYTDLQKQCFGDIIEKVAYDLEWYMREELARRIAAESHAPRKLVHRLAHDEIAVARPVLEQSPVLTEEDLVQVSENLSQDHLIAITKRMDIGTRLSAVLVDRGGVLVVDSLVQNQKAKISPDDIQRVAKRAESSHQLQLALVKREDLPKDVMIGLVEHVSEKLKAELQEKIADSDMLNLEEVVGDMKAGITESKASRAERYVEELARRGELNERRLLRLVSEEKSLEFLLGLAKFLRIDISTAQQAITDETGEALSIVLRAAGFSATSFKEIAMSPITSIPSDLTTILALVRVYQRMPRENAQRVLRFALTRQQVS